MAYKYIEGKEKTYAKAYKVYSGSGGSISVDIKNKYPAVDYTQLTAQDFVVSYKSDSDISYSSHSTGSDSDTYYIMANGLGFNKSYNASNGVLSVSLTNSKADDYYRPGGTGASNWSGLQIEVLMIVDGVRSEYV